MNINDYKEFIEELEYIETWCEIYSNTNYQGILNPQLLKVLITEEKFSSAYLQENELIIFIKGQENIIKLVIM